MLIQNTASNNEFRSLGKTSDGGLFKVFFMLDFVHVDFQPGQLFVPIVCFDEVSLFTVMEMSVLKGKSMHGVLSPWLRDSAVNG